jgi:hypothetical protein
VNEGRLAASGFGKFNSALTGEFLGCAAANDTHDLRGGVLMGETTGLPDREPKSHSEKASEGEVKSGEEHVVFGEERRELRIEVAEVRLTIRFLKRSGDDEEVIMAVADSDMLYLISRGMGREGACYRCILTMGKDRIDSVKLSLTTPLMTGRKGRTRERLRRISESVL